jgi:hypothetical protein
VTVVADGNTRISVASAGPTLSGTVTLGAVSDVKITGGTSGQAVVTDGSGNLSFAAAGAAITDDTSTNGTRYILFDDVTTGIASSVGVSSTKLTFNPSTGLLSVGSLAVTGNVTFNGATTIGDASGDAFTINSSAVSVPNGLNFDSNTLVIDATNNRIGVNVATASYKLHVGGDIYSSVSAGSNLIIEKSSGASIAFKEDGVDVALIEALDAAAGIRFYTGTGGTITEKVRISSAGHLLPGANDSYDLGSTSLVWRNIYTGDLHLSNESKTEGNSVDGTKGNWTLQEGEEHLFIINNKNGKKYKFSLEEIA